MQALVRQALSLPRNVTTTYCLGATHPSGVQAALGVIGASIALDRVCRRR